MLLPLCYYLAVYQIFSLTRNILVFYLVVLFIIYYLFAYILLPAKCFFNPPGLDGAFDNIDTTHKSNTNLI